jgi:zinc protease
VRNELRQNYENRPYGIVDLAIYRMLFPAGHPYRGAVIGTHADVQAAKLEDLKRFFKLYYAPNNASLVIAGDIDKPAAKQLVEKYFGSLRRGPDVPRVKVATPAITAERRAVITDRVELQRVSMGWLTPPAFAPGDAELDFAAQILGGGKSSRLYKKLVYELKIAQDVGVSQLSSMLCSMFSVEVTARPGRTAKEVEAAVEAELTRFRDEGPTEQEIERARNTIETSFLQGLEKIGVVADALNRYAFYTGDPGFLPRDLERYRKVTREAVRSVARAQLAPSARVVVHAVPGRKDLGPQVPAPPPQKHAPGAGAEAVNADEPWRSEVPKPGPPRAFKLPAPKSFKLENGLTVIYHERRDLPVVAVRLVVRAGSESNPSRRPGLASFTADLLTEGTASRSALQIADEAAQLGTSIDAGATADASVVYSAALKHNFPAVLDLLADVVRRPAFPQGEIERQRASREAALLQQREEPASMAAEVMLDVLYGPQHPYGYTGLGNERSLKATRRADLDGFWRRYYVPGNAALIVTGDIGEQDLRALAKKAFGDWKGGRASAATLPAPRIEAARVVLVDKAGAPSTALLVAQPGPARSTPDYAALQIMNAALGGLFTSRVNLNLREEKGYTYGAASGFSFRRGGGPFMVRSTVRADVSGAALKEMFREVERMAKEPPAGEELEKARNSQLLTLPSDFETNAATAGAFAQIYVYGLESDYYDRLPGLLRAVDARQVERVARAYLVPAKMKVIAVGDRGRVESQLKALGLGPIEVRSAQAEATR